MLDQIGFTTAIRAGVRFDLRYGVPLVVARKDHDLTCPPSRLRALFGAIDMDKPVKDVQPRILRPDALPQIRSLLAAAVRRVAFTEVVPEVERKEPRRLPLKLGRHRHCVGIDREMDKDSPAESHVLRIPIRAVLLDRVLDEF